MTPRRITVPEEAPAWLARVRLAVVAPWRDLPSLVTAVVGGPTGGSWWGHEQGPLIYDCLMALQHTGDVLSTKLVAGRVTLLHRSLWPALVRVVTDARWRARGATKLDATARRVLAELEAAGELDAATLRARAEVDARQYKRARDVLAREVLVHSAEVHTERGSHDTVLSTWSRWVPPELVEAARGLPFDGAATTLREACLGVATPLDEV
jgi:hypothetical protein